MALAPTPAAPLTPEQALAVADIEAFVDDCMRRVGVRQSVPFIVYLRATPDAAVAVEVRKRYLAAGWSKVLLGLEARTGAPFLQLESYVDVFLSRRPE